MFPPSISGHFDFSNGPKNDEGIVTLSLIRRNDWRQVETLRDASGQMRKHLTSGPKRPSASSPSPQKRKRWIEL